MKSKRAEEALRLQAAAIKRLETLNRQESFDPKIIGSRATTAQQEVIDAVFDDKLMSNIFVLGGNQCLAKGTKVLTARGIISIEDVKIGDTVFDENSNPIEVIQVHNNGKKQIGRITYRGIELVKCTKDHIFLVEDGHGRFHERKAGEFKRDDRIVRNAVINKDTLKEEVDPSLVGIRRVEAKFELLSEWEDTYDITVNSTRNLYCLANGLVTHNSGKSLLSLRVMSWLFNNEKRLPHQGEDFFGIILSRTSKQIEESIWMKLEPCLLPGTYKCIRQGNMLQTIHSTINNNRIVFQSYENESTARERVQAYTADLIMIDEMPRSKALLEEAQRRVQARRGKLISAFTPKIVSPEVRDIIDASALPYSKKFFLAMLDNPVYNEEDKKRILAELNAYSESYRNTILTGAWLTAGNLVYSFDMNHIVRPLPETYSRGWKHYISADPALDSKFGIVIAAQDPDTCFWHVILADYIDKPTLPDRAIMAVKNKMQHLNIIKRKSDSSPWFVNMMNDERLYFTTPYDKNNRRLEMITKVQSLIGSKVFLTPHLTDLIDEASIYEWSDGGKEKIVNADKFHLLDALRYMVDDLPPDDLPIDNKPWQQQLREADLKRRAKEEITKNTNNTWRMSSLWKRRR